MAELEKMFNHFWWNSTIHWMRWERLCQAKEKGGLNFRSLHDFNFAMLTKQTWKLIKEPESLMSRIFKARYFPNTSFFEAVTSSNSSFIWRGFMRTKFILQHGMSFRIGNGLSIPIWNTNWLPSTTHPSIQSEPYPGFENASVNALFSENGTGWDEQLLELMFSYQEQLLIRQIHRPWNPSEDSLFWRLEPTGHFSVKSCYYALIQFSGINTLNSNFESPFCANLWSLNVPSKVLNFLWKVATNCLPVLTSLRDKHVDVNPLCPICEDGNENIYHALLGCCFVFPIWNEFFPEGWTINIHSFDTWWKWLWTNNKSIIEKATCTLWAIWARRNHFIWNNKFRVTSQVIRHGVGYLHEWQAANRNTTISRSERNQVWRNPPKNWLKCNVDASIFESGTRMGHGCVIRDDRGKVCAARSLLLEGGGDPFMAEALSCREALSWLKSLSLNQVKVELDAINVVSALNNDLIFHSPIGFIFQDCKQLMLSFSNIKVVYVHRSANPAAHLLAKATDSSTNRGTWFHVCPPLIRDVTASN